MTPSPYARHFSLDERVVFLNHGSFGATPRAVQTLQSQLRARMEAQPVQFLVRDLEALLDAARMSLARFVRCDPDGIGLVANATTGVNSVLRSLTFAPGDELLTTDHTYNACANALRFVAERSGAKVVIAKVPFPLTGEGEVTEAVMAAVTDRTKIVLIDHVTSPTGLVFPVAEIVRRLSARGVETLVDGAHAPGMVPLDLEALGAAWYTGNLHKWVCAPKGAGFLYARRDVREAVRPTVISHGANFTHPCRSRFRLEFDWTGTVDPTPWLCVPEALRVVGAMSPDGWEGVMRDNRALALRARDILCDALGVRAPAPDGMLGSLAAIPLPDEPDVSKWEFESPLQKELRERHQIEVPVMPWPRLPGRLVRVSAQKYNTEEAYRALAAALAPLRG